MAVQSRTRKLRTNSTLIARPPNTLDPGVFLTTPHTNTTTTSNSREVQQPLTTSGDSACTNPYTQLARTGSKSTFSVIKSSYCAGWNQRVRSSSLHPASNLGRIPSRCLWPFVIGPLPPSLSWDYYFLPRFILQPSDTVSARYVYVTVL